MRGELSISSILRYIKRCSENKSLPYVLTTPNAYMHKVAIELPEWYKRQTFTCISLSKIHSDASDLITLICDLNYNPFPRIKPLAFFCGLFCDARYNLKRIYRLFTIGFHNSFKPTSLRPAWRVRAQRTFSQSTWKNLLVNTDPVYILWNYDGIFMAFLSWTQNCNEYIQ